MFFVTASAGESAAVNVEEHGQTTICSCTLGRPYVEEKTILAVCVLLALAELVVVEYLFYIVLLIIEGAWLIGAISVACSVVNSLPGGNLLGILPSAGGGVSDTLEGYYAVKTAGCAQYLATGTGDLFIHNFLSAQKVQETESKIGSVSKCVRLK